MEGSLVQLASPGAFLVDNRNCGCCPQKPISAEEWHRIGVMASDNTYIQFLGRMFLPGFPRDIHRHDVVDGRCRHRGCRFPSAPEFIKRLAALIGW